MDVACEETFGPVAPLFRFHSEDEVIQAANATPFGLAAYFYSRDPAQVMGVSAQLPQSKLPIEIVVENRQTSSPVCTEPQTHACRSGFEPCTNGLGARSNAMGPS